ncbi:MAG TPA: porin [Myxococcus sp.]|jgi:hypothetical protein|nr:porin [Myxococcus sp.]
MKPQNLMGTLAAIALALPAAANAAEVVRTEDAALDVGARLQLLGFAQKLDDAYRNDARLYLFLKQGRLSVSGNYGDVKFKAQLALGGEAEIKAPNPGVSLDLLDLYVDAKLTEGLHVRVGQYKTLYSRERLTDSAVLPFADRSIQNLAFRMGRDVGIAVHGKAGPAVMGLGVLTGGGRDVPERYLPQNLGMPMLMVRAGVDFGTGENVFAETEKTGAPDRVQGAVFFNGFYLKDSQVGHSTVLTTKFSEKSLLINANWNPYLTQAPTATGKQWQVGGDAVVRAPAGPGFVTGEVEFNYGVYQNDYGDIRMPGGRLQVGYNWQPVEVNVRYAVVKPDGNFRFGTSNVTGTKAFQEITPALTLQLPKYNSKIVMDLPIHLNTPVITEENVGAYMLTEQPDQTSLLKNNAPIARQNVIEARMMFQAAF